MVLDLLTLLQCPRGPGPKICTAACSMNVNISFTKFGKSYGGDSITDRLMDGI